MTVDRNNHGDKVAIHCDAGSGCQAFFEGEPDQGVEHFWPSAKAAGWRHQKLAPGAWFHACPACQIPLPHVYKSSRPSRLRFRKYPTTAAFMAQLDQRRARRRRTRLASTAADLLADPYLTWSVAVLAFMIAACCVYDTLMLDPLPPLPPGPVVTNW
jgi:hypothetical protein